MKNVQNAEKDSFANQIWFVINSTFTPPTDDINAPIVENAYDQTHRLIAIGSHVFASNNFSLAPTQMGRMRYV